MCTMLDSLNSSDARYGLCVSVKVKVVYPHVSFNDRYLTIKRDDVIVDVEKVDGHWCVGSLDGKRGLFPFTYVQVLAEGKIW